MKTDITYPYKVKTRFGSVKIYREENRFCVAWPSEEGRRRQRFSDEDEAHQRASEIISDFHKGMALRNEISSVIAVNLKEYETTLAVYGATIGDAVRAFVAAKHKEHSRKVLAPVAVKEFLDSFEIKKGRNYQTARSITNAFSRSFSGNLDEITVTELDTYLRGVSTNGRTRNNHLGYLETFFRWAKKWKEYLPNGEMPIENIPAYPESESKIEVFSMEEIKSLLYAADENLIPYLAVGAFAGVRCAEITRLRWEDFKLEERVIELNPWVTKTKRRRLALMSENLMWWISSTKGDQTGPICPNISQLHNSLSALCKKVGIKWKNNGLRKSYISYCMALPESNSAIVAKQCGTSPGMVEERYKGLVSPKLAEEWFRIYPIQ